MSFAACGVSGWRSHESVVRSLTILHKYFNYISTDKTPGNYHHPPSVSSDAWYHLSQRRRGLFRPPTPSSTAERLNRREGARGHGTVGSARERRGGEEAVTAATRCRLSVSGRGLTSGLRRPDTDGGCHSLTEPRARRETRYDRPGVSGAGTVSTRQWPPGTMSTAVLADGDRVKDHTGWCGLCQRAYWTSGTVSYTVHW